MQCGATLASGRRCQRESEAGLAVCSYHRGTDDRRREREFYTKRLFPEEQQAVVDGAQLEGMDAEIPVLRVLIRRVVDAGDIEAARKGIATLLQVLRVSHKLDEPVDDYWATMDRVLEKVGEDLGIDLGAPAGPGEPIIRATPPLARPRKLELGGNEPPEGYPDREQESEASV